MILVDSLLILVSIVYKIFSINFKKFQRRLEDVQKEVVELENNKKNLEKINEELQMEIRKLREEKIVKNNFLLESRKNEKKLSEKLEKLEKREKNQAKELRALKLKNLKMTEELRKENKSVKNESKQKKAKKKTINLSRLSMECIISYMDPNRRLLLSFRTCRAFVKMEKSVPIYIENIEITASSIRVNNKEYSVKGPNIFSFRSRRCFAESPVDLLYNTIQSGKTIETAMKKIISILLAGRPHLKYGNFKCEPMSLLDP